MKILFYIHSLVIGGAETIVVNEMINLKKSGIDVVLVVNKSENTYLEQKVNKYHIKVYYLNKPYPTSKFGKLVWKINNRMISYKKLFDSIIENEHPDIIHVNTTIDRINGINFPINRIVYSFHAEVNRALQISSRKSVKLLFKYAKQGMAFFALSDEMQENIKKIFETNRVYKIPNSVNINEIAENKYDRKEFLPLLGIPYNAYVLGHVGRFNKVKNHEKIISIFKKLHSENPNSYLILIGGDTDNRMQMIKEKVESFGLTENVLFLGVREDAVSIMSCFDGFVLPSFSESFSIALIEAEVHGIRCIASENVPDDVICNGNCFKMSIDESDDEWIKLLLSSYEKDNNRDLNQFDINTVNKKLIYAYEEIINA